MQYVSSYLSLFKNWWKSTYFFVAKSRAKSIPGAVSGAGACWGANSRGRVILMQTENESKGEIDRNYARPKKTRQSGDTVPDSEDLGYLAVRRRQSLYWLDWLTRDSTNWEKDTGILCMYIKYGTVALAPGAPFESCLRLEWGLIPAGQSHWLEAWSTSCRSNDIVISEQASAANGLSSLYST